MSELDRARAHLRVCQKNLLASRRWGVVGDTDENAVLAALSWVWEEQETARLVWQPIARGRKVFFERAPRGREPRSLPQLAGRL